MGRLRIYKVIFTLVIWASFFGGLGPVFSETQGSRKTKEKITEVAKTTQRNPTLLESTWLMPQVSVVMPSDLSLSSPGLSVNYTGQVLNFSQAGLASVTPLFNLGGFRILATARLGFSYKSDSFEFLGPKGEAIRDTLRLFWVPMSLGTKMIYTLPDFPYIKPSLTFGGGTHYFYQTGNFSGSNRSYWVPYYFISPALSFLEGTAPSDWFGGFTFGVTYQNDLSSSQNVSGVSFDMGINILL